MKDYADGVLELMDKLNIEKKRRLSVILSAGGLRFTLRQSIPKKSKNSCWWTARELSPEGG
ncbi:MAG: hypothetical protein L6V85_05875 [Clostridiales bacterium]|nr:MAG: hypothetical protein L6V85_05875 [Clostridiales bacterium]